MGSIGTRGGGRGTLRDPTPPSSRTGSPDGRCSGSPIGRRTYRRYHQKFTDKHDLDITLLSDPDKETMGSYGAWKEKKMYGKTFLGIHRSTVLIDPDGKVAHVWPKVKAKGHADAVKERLAELQG